MIPKKLVPAEAGMETVFGQIMPMPKGMIPKSGLRFSDKIMPMPKNPRRAIPERYP
jgi:hypothetical protein